MSVRMDFISRLCDSIDTFHITRRTYGSYVLGRGNLQIEISDKMISIDDDNFSGKIRDKNMIKFLYSKAEKAWEKQICDAHEKEEIHTMEYALDNYLND